MRYILDCFNRYLLRKWLSLSLSEAKRPKRSSMSRPTEIEQPSESERAIYEEVRAIFF